MSQSASNAASGYCSCALNINNKKGTYNWTEAVIGQTVSQNCSYGAPGQNVNVTRYCTEKAWIENATECPTKVTNEFNMLRLKLQNVRRCASSLSVGK